MTADLLVIGGGPVGLGAAIEARLAGLDVVVAEPRTGPIDKACGEGLMPGALASLTRWGVAVEGRPIAGFRYTDGRRHAVHRFRGAQGAGVARTTLHVALAARADDLGVVRLPIAVRTLRQDARGVSVDDVGADGLRARWAIAADGLHSATRRSLGLEQRASRRARYGLRRHFGVAPWTDLVEVHWTPCAELYVTPVADGTVGVAVLGQRGLDLGAAIAAVPALAARLAGAAPADAVRGAGPLRQRARRIVHGRVALVGDAAGYIDALTGEGLAIGFASARIAVSAVARGDLSGLERRLAAATRASRAVTSGALALAVSPARTLVVPIAAAVPALFGAAVEVLGRPVPIAP